MIPELTLSSPMTPGGAPSWPGAVWIGVADIAELIRQGRSGQFLGVVPDAEGYKRTSSDPRRADTAAVRAGVAHRRSRAAADSPPAILSPHQRSPDVGRPMYPGTP